MCVWGRGVGEAKPPQPKTAGSVGAIAKMCFFFSNIFEHISSEDRFIAHLNNKENKHLNSSLNSKRSRCILIGPEGDFTDHEVSLSCEQNFIEVSLGNARLRTETSGVVSTAILNL